MARHFGVSARTVYRWVEALSMTDVPVYAEKGKGGGIRISENYAIDKAGLTEREKLDVLASAEGTVTKVYTNDLEGTVVIIKHNDVYTAKYGSLDTNVLVKEGDTVKRGQKIGEISSTAKNETKSGKHLHFQLFRDEGEVNPADYLNLETK